MQNRIKSVMVYIFDRIIPLYAVIPVISCFVWNGIVYGGVRIINEGRTHFDMTLPIDGIIPVIPEFIVVYFGCFATWGIYYILNVRVGKTECARFVTFDLLTRTICMIIFLAVPTYNVRPQVDGADLFSHALRFLYDYDAADNLFPSIHCIVSWNCFVGIRDLKCYKKRYKVIAFVIAVLVFISTLVTKQHVIGDVISAVFISEICWGIVCKSRIYEKVWLLFDKINKKVFSPFIKGKGNLI